MSADPTMRLAYRIASSGRAVLPHPSALPPGTDQAALAGKVAAEARLVAKAEHFIFDNVASFYFAHDRMAWDCAEDIPNWAPPFELLFAEWAYPETANMPGVGLTRLEVAGKQVGTLAISLPVEGEPRMTPAGWQALLSNAVGFSAELPGMEKALSASRWVIYTSTWMSSPDPPIVGRPMWSGISHFLFVAGSGRLVARYAGGLMSGVYMRIAGSEQAGRDALFSSLHVLGLGLSFCHCKNVRVADAPVDRGERWHRRTRTPVLRFRTVDINPMKETLRREGRSDEVGLPRALHICRGHFANYTEASPLFGRYVGTFWRPDHVRGSLEHGAVVKDYRGAGEVPAGGGRP